MTAAALTIKEDAVACLCLDGDILIGAGAMGTASSRMGRGEGVRWCLRDSLLA
jgi:hypothetical protein